MRYVLAPDSFKESMTAAEAAAAMEEGIRVVDPDATCLSMPMSDGGEGFIDALITAWGATTVTVEVPDALGRPVTARYGLLGQRAVMDVASSAGLELIAPEDRDIMRSNTAGLGIMIRHALDRGARRILLGIGGSATNDAGVGMLHVLGLRLRDADGQDLDPRPSELDRVVSVDRTGLDPRLAGLEIKVACDVTNPLTGEDGASAVFAPQKGALPHQVPVLDRRLAHLAQVSDLTAVARHPGAGAAGGLGFALMGFLGARLVPGVDLVAEAVGLGEAVKDADYVFTGEGSVDSQTIAGKTPAGVADIAAAASVPCLVFAGRIQPGAEALLERGVQGIVKVGSPDEPLSEALRHGRRNLRDAVVGILRREPQVVPGHSSTQA